MGYILIIGVMSYLFGCIHGSQIVGKIKDIDIKNSGVKNAGASNTTLLLGWKFGIIVAFVDIMKAVIPIVVVSLMGQHYLVAGEVIHLLMFVAGFFVVIGHIFPITMNFSGGKGTASMIGMLLALDWKITVICLLALIIFTLLSDYLVIGVFFMYLAFTLTTLLFGFGLYPTLMGLILMAISSYKHIENYYRISKKTEVSISSMFKKKSTA
ncbi:glycerol-3-phosphate acyltransferase [Alkalihalobacillus trypoxylicola]|uniref:Glycerol-3-phosphate acyltransferase n=1 Tax=Alkalihalobacillus trypoxylicola TaxID=519424 RepID=A0A161PZR8_9BACI|nr:glycerol-3-phosphate acyltransferase [Alkalihalobacillus trypoxylicola]KYG28275.1 glycerol-3-phosphate acyltransferase 1 [Alkalihalobacillus trypoxylicola]